MPIQLAITQLEAVVFGLLTLPVTIWIVWTDVTDMKIKNAAVLATLAIFIFAGFFVMPFDDYSWRYAHIAVALSAGILLSVTIGLGAGDAKYIAAAAPMVVLPDLGTIALLYCGWSLLLLIGMLTARRSRTLRAAAPGWVWFEEERRSYVPFGLSLAPTMSSYFLLGALA